jgi:Major Facilitator Superfamily
VSLPTGRDLRVLLGAQFCGQAADGIAQTAFTNILVLEPLGQETPTRVLALFALTLVPYSLLAPWLGVLVDRWDRRGLLGWTNSIRAGLLITFPLWVSSIPGDTFLYATVLALLGLGRLWLTTKGAILPLVLNEQHLLRGNSISGGGGMLAALAGGVLGIGLIAVAGDSPAVVAAGVLYAVSALISTRLSTRMSPLQALPSRLSSAAARAGAEMLHGLTVIWRNSRVRIALAAIFVLRTIVMFVAVATILAVKSRFPGAEDRFGRLSSGALALALAGAGAFTGAVVAPVAGRALNRSRLVLLGFAIPGLGLVALGPLASLSALMALAFVAGFGAFTAKVAVDAEVQGDLTDEFRGRAFALYDILYNLASVMAAALMVAFGGATRLGPALLLAGVFTFLAATGLGLVMQREGMLSSVAGD